MCRVPCRAVSRPVRYPMLECGIGIPSFTLFTMINVFALSAPHTTPHARAGPIYALQGTTTSIQVDALAHVLSAPQP